MKIILLGAAGFIGTNLTLKLAEDKNNRITLVDVNKEYFSMQSYWYWRTLKSKSQQLI